MSLPRLLRHSGLRLKLLAGFGIVVAMLVLTASVGVASMARLASAQRQTQRHIVPLVAAAGRAKAAFSDSHYSQAGSVMTGDVRRQNYLADRGVFRQSLDGLRAEAETAPDRRAYGAVVLADRGFEAVDARVHALLAAGRSRAAIALEVGADNDAADRVSAALGAMVTVAEHEQALASVRFASTRKTSTTLAIILAMVATIAAAMIALLLSRSISRRAEAILQALGALSRDCIRPLRDGASAMATGDLTHEVRGSAVPIDDRSGDELGRVAQAVDMIGTDTVASAVAYEHSRQALSGLLRHVQGTAADVFDASSGVASVSGESRRAVSEVAAAVGEVANGAERQVQALGAADDRLREISTASSVAAESAHAAADAAAATRTIADDGTASVLRAEHAMREVSSSSDKTAAAIARLGIMSDKIGGIVQTITAIAEQTNLLALNAAIEAARAGEHGRGFAVVAEEVRSLAEEAQSAAGNISELVADIQVNTADAVSAVADGVRETAKGVSTVDEAGQAFTIIAQHVTDVTERISDIAAAMSQLADSSAQASDDVKTAAAVAEQTSASSEEVSATAQETSASTQEIADSAQTLAANAGELRTLVSRFTIGDEE